MQTLRTRWSLNWHGRIVNHSYPRGMDFIVFNDLILILKIEY
jgi:hypothetical protein